MNAVVLGVCLLVATLLVCFLGGMASALLDARRERAQGLSSTRHPRAIRSLIVVPALMFLGLHGLASRVNGRSV